jgi:hypothetical protein
MKVVSKSNDAKKRIKRAIEKSYIFKGLDKEQIQTVGKRNFYDFIVVFLYTHTKFYK